MAILRVRDNEGNYYDIPVVKGDKPIKGVDYYTVEEKEEFVAYIDNSIAEHRAATDNPHEVTKEQVGLGNADNTSDADKPVSTHQANAIADAKSAGTKAQTAANNAKSVADTANSKAANALERLDSVDAKIRTIETNQDNTNVALNRKLPLDGSSAMTGNLKMGGKNIVNVGYPSAATDAATKGYVDTKSNIVKLWENPQPKTYFEAQRINLTLTGYEFFIVRVANIAGDTGDASIVFPNQLHRITFLNDSNGYREVKFTTSNNQVSIGDLEGCQIENDYTTVNPVAIYGVKGVTV